MRIAEEGVDDPAHSLRRRGQGAPACARYRELACRRWRDNVKRLKYLAAYPTEVRSGLPDGRQPVPPPTTPKRSLGRLPRPPVSCSPWPCSSWPCSASGGDCAAHLDAKLGGIDLAVNNVPDGTPPMVQQVTWLFAAVAMIAEQAGYDLPPKPEAAPRVAHTRKDDR